MVDGIASRHQQTAMSVASSSSCSYPLLAVFWTIFEVFLFEIWFWILISVFIDMYRSPDLSGLAKALWFRFVLFISLSWPSCSAPLDRRACRAPTGRWSSRSPGCCPTRGA
jgi:hypothetical protein